MGLVRHITSLSSNIKDGVSSAATGVRLQGKHVDAEAMDRRMLNLKGAVLGKGHSDTLAGINNLAVVLRLYGKYTEAEGMRKRAL